MITSIPVHRGNSLMVAGWSAVSAVNWSKPRKTEQRGTDGPEGPSRRSLAKMETPPGSSNMGRGGVRTTESLRSEI